MATKTFPIYGMRCGHCKAQVETALQALDGVAKANANLEDKNVEVEFDDTKVTANAMKNAVAEVGFDLEA